jgi:hypothetical protein
MELLRVLNDPIFASQSVVFAASSVSTVGWPVGPDGVVVWATSACIVVVNDIANPTVTANGTHIPANTPIPFAVECKSGRGWNVSCVQIAAGGTLYAKPMNRT